MALESLLDRRGIAVWALGALGLVASFLHVGTAAFGTAAPLSGFLTGETVPDPVVAATSHTFGELEARAVRLAQIAGSVCRPGAIAKLELSSLPPLPPVMLRPVLRSH